MSTFNARKSAMARDASIMLADEAASEAWKNQALAAVRRVATYRQEFTTDAVWYLLDKGGVPQHREPRAMGALMLRAVRLGICMKIPNRTQQSVRVECHRRPLSVYLSRIFASRPPSLISDSTAMEKTP